MKNRSLNCALSLILVTTICMGQNSYPLWHGIEAGKYKVGLKLLEFIDSTRTTKPKYDDSGNINSNRFFPLQIAIWYPTQEGWDSKVALKYKEYFYKTAQKNDFAELSNEQKEKAMDIFYNFAKYGANRELSQAEQEALGNTETAAILNATPINQKRPVIMAGHDGGVWKMSTLCEYLASHGYVVISSGWLSQTSSIFRQNPHDAINRRIRTFEIVRGMLNQFEFVDENQVGLLGLNGDGMSTLLYQMKNREAKAIANIDGWDGKNNGSDNVRSSVYFNPDQVKVPFLEFQQHETPPPNESLRLNTTIFDSLRHVDRFSFVLQQFGHAYLTGNLIALPGLPDGIMAQYNFCYSFIKDFFGAYVKEDRSSFDSLWKPLDQDASLFHIKKQVRSD